MDTLVKFCMAGLVIGAWFSEYVLIPMYRKVQILNAYRIKLVRTLADEAHPMLLFTLLVGLCILLVQVNAERNSQFIKQNPSIQVSNWSIIP